MTTPTPAPQPVTNAEQFAPDVVALVVDALSTAPHMDSRGSFIDGEAVTRAEALAVLSALAAAGRLVPPPDHTRPTRALLAGTLRPHFTAVERGTGALDSAVDDVLSALSHRPVPAEAVARQQFGVRLMWDDGRSQEFERDSRAGAEAMHNHHVQQRREVPGWLVTSALIRREVGSWAGVATGPHRPHGGIMIVTVTPTIMSGTVVRWFLGEYAAEEVEPLISASRDGVRINGYLHEVPDEVLSAANAAHFALSRNRSDEVAHLATHRHRGIRGPLEPVPTTGEPS